MSHSAPIILSDESRITLLPSKVFVRIIALIEQEISGLLCQFSVAVKEPVKALFQGNLDLYKKYRIEQIRRSDILDSLRTSDCLRILISSLRA